ncbi:hypothetical protein VCH24_39440 [Variovorax boronicumulans]|nr:hypothetical protein VCH24_39440 [Variovorax boronicumulans]
MPVAGLVTGVPEGVVRPLAVMTVAPVSVLALSVLPERGTGRETTRVRSSSGGVVLESVIDWLLCFGLRWGVASRGRVSPRQATYFSLLRQRNVGKRKATLLSASLRFAAGNLRCSRFAGSRPNSLRSNKGEP